MTPTLEQMSRKWQAALAAPVTLQRDDGMTIALTGRQVVGLSDKAKESPSGLVRFACAGRNVTMSISVLDALRARVEAQVRPLHPTT
mmetsp:Transcript_71952/g.142656  ORF Transcript_71952/g.142656 Transcript_71952/m.142656 type:complete len:87 (+) Transcript_71952:82-342(+)